MFSCCMPKSELRSRSVSRWLRDSSAKPYEPLVLLAHILFQLVFKILMKLVYSAIRHCVCGGDLQTYMILQVTAASYGEHVKETSLVGSFTDKSKRLEA